MQMRHKELSESEMTSESSYLDMLDTAAYKLARLVQIPRYVKYLQRENRKKHSMLAHRYINVHTAS